MENGTQSKKQNEFELPERLRQKLMDLRTNMAIMDKQMNDLMDTFFEAKGITVPKGAKINMSEDMSKVVIGS